MHKDKTILRDLAKRYREVGAQPIQKERRDLWRAHNSLKATRPLIYIRSFVAAEMPECRCVCEDQFCRGYEGWFRSQLFWDSLNDDSVFEPWVTVRAVFSRTGWGVEIKRHYSDEARGSFKVDYPLKELADIEKLAVPRHAIDEKQTDADAVRLRDMIGDIITINVDRTPVYRGPLADISNDLGYLRGIENFMTDMYDNPEWLHGLVKFMSGGILKTHAEAEAAGDWGLTSHDNQAMNYAEELPDPAPNVRGIKRARLWARMAAQEFTGVSPAMHAEFLLRYQLPILKQFGLTAYGCCEDLTNKIDMLRQIPNLRRIAVSPMANAARCAEQIGQDYVLSYRPSPADMVSYGYDEDRVRKIVGRDLAACRNCHVDITLKDVETVEGDPTRIRRWVQLVREIIAETWR